MAVCSPSNTLLQLPRFFSFSFITSFFFFFFLIISCATPLQFDFPSFGPDDTNRSITLTGNASISARGIQLTRDPNEGNGSLSKWNVGRATYTQPLRLWDDEGKLTDFTTHFSFVIVKSANSDLGQGLAFFLAPNGSSIPPESAGGYLGIGSSVSQENAFVAVEFDTYRNNEYEGNLAFNHVGILLNSMSSVQNVTWQNNFLWERTYQAWISYNSSSKNLSVDFTSFGDDDTERRNSIYYVVDLRDYLPEWATFGFSAATSDVFERNEIKSWEFNAAAAIQRGKKVNVGLVVGLSVGSCVLVVGLSFLGVFLWRKRSRGEKDKVDLDPTMDFPKRLSYGELARATNNFSEEYKLGEGGFGGVYRGFLREFNSYVAIKRISRGSRQGPKEYVAEISIISRLRHRNLVQLMGWCHEKRELLLVYEFLANGSLDSHLFTEKNSLKWEVRYKIVKGLASALLYLHEEGDQCVLHRDIKPSNVLLDSDFNVKLGDFGLARLIDHQKASPTTDLAGTMGYMAIEYVMTQKASKESDVYSFGVVVLEIGCGRKFNAFSCQETSQMITIVDWVWNLYGTGNLLDAADQKLGGQFDEKEMECLLMVGLWCANPDYNIRPSIRQAVLTLNFESPLPSLPTEKPPVPASFGFTGNTPSFSVSSSYTANSSGSNNVQASSYSHSAVSTKSETSSAASSSFTPFCPSHSHSLTTSDLDKK